jgi:hypothetical protein
MDGYPSIVGRANASKNSDLIRRAAQLFGSLGGKARAKALTPAQRREIAQKAIRARWEREKKAKGARK